MTKKRFDKNEKPLQVVFVRAFFITFLSFFQKIKICLIMLYITDTCLEKVENYETTNCFKTK